MPPRVLRSSLVALFLIVSIVAARHRAETTTTIILVRHAEKAAAPADDPPLTAEGEARAAALVRAVRGAGIGVIYSTPFKRTQGTAAPVASSLGIPVTSFHPSAGARSYGELYAAEILAKHRGKVVLVVGHSNTLPGIATALGARDVPPIPESDYTNLFIVSVPETGEVRIIRAEFGR